VPVHVGVPAQTGQCALALDPVGSGRKLADYPDQTTAGDGRRGHQEEGMSMMTCVVASGAAAENAKGSAGESMNEAEFASGGVSASGDRRKVGSLAMASTRTFLGQHQCPIRRVKP
jgi:hypothetical protein